MVNLILSLDYELYGDGSGSVIDDIVHPTETMLEICKKHGVRITIFVEVVELWELNKTYLSGNSMGYQENPAEMMKKQLIEAHKDGHDIQLHLHPQWLGAEYSEKGWLLNESLHRLANVATEKRDNEINLIELLHNGKETLESLIQSVDKTYRCRVLRAGGLNILPSDNILKQMRITGLEADSSVFSGGYENTQYSMWDYRSVKNDDAYWFTESDDIMEQSKMDSGSNHSLIAELPIFALPLKRYRKYNLSRLRTKMGNLRGVKTTFTRGKARISRSKNFREKISYLFDEEFVMWDFCLLSYKQMKSFYSRAREINNHSNYDYHPFVLIGHSKEFKHKKKFEKFLRFAVRKNTAFNTMSEALNKIQMTIPVG